jgi:hypothetical protein
MNELNLRHVVVMIKYLKIKKIGMNLGINWEERI